MAPCYSHSVSAFSIGSMFENKYMFCVCFVCWQVVFKIVLTRRNGGRVCALQKRRADSLGMQQAGLHRWKQSVPHCHRRCTSPLQAVDCHRLAQREKRCLYSHAYVATHFSWSYLRQWRQMHLKVCFYKVESSKQPYH